MKGARRVWGAERGNRSRRRLKAPFFYSIEQLNLTSGAGPRGHAVAKDYPGLFGLCNSLGGYPSGRPLRVHFAFYYKIILDSFYHKRLLHKTTLQKPKQKIANSYDDPITWTNSSTIIISPSFQQEGLRCPTYAKQVFKLGMVGLSV